MIAKDENLLVKLVKRSLGLPTGNSSCGCGAPAAKANDCNAEASEKASTQCGCESIAIQQHEEQPAEP